LNQCHIELSECIQYMYVFKTIQKEFDVAETFNLITYKKEKM